MERRAVIVGNIIKIFDSASSYGILGVFLSMAVRLYACKQYREGAIGYPGKPGVI